MKYIYIFLLFILSAKGFCQDQSPALENAYQTNSETALLGFLNSWANSTFSITAEELKKSTNLEQEAYHIFKAFYNPKKLSQIKGFAPDSNLNQAKDFLILQNTLSIVVMEKIYATDEELKAYMVKKMKAYPIKDTSRFNIALKQIEIDPYSDKLVVYHPYRENDGTTGIIEKHNVENFRPTVQLSKTKLYFSASHEEELRTFIKAKNLKLDAINTYNESIKRLAFLNKKLSIMSARLGYNFISNPQVYSMQVNKELTVAKVNFRINHAGGYAVLIKQNGQWLFKSITRTWVS